MCSTIPSIERIEIARKYSIGSFSEAEAFLDREIGRDGRIKVIIGNEDDAARFYKRICAQYSSYGVQLNWREKAYGRLNSPKIEIGSVEYFVSKYSESRGKIPVSAVFLHAEQKLEDSYDSRFEPGSWDNFIEELFVVTSITMEHYKELLEKSVNDSANLTKLIRSWPSEYQVFGERLVIDLWNKLFSMYSSPDREREFERSMDVYAKQLIKSKMKQFEVPPNCQRFKDENLSKFVCSARVARKCELGRDYVVYSERSSGSLRLRIRLKKQLSPAFGLLQFLELRHGCEMTPYRVSKGIISPADLVHVSRELLLNQLQLKSFDRVLIIQRSSPFRSHTELKKRFDIQNVFSRHDNIFPMHFTTSSPQFPITVATEAAMYSDYLILVVCSTSSLLLDVVERLKKAANTTVCICETPLVVLNESSKNHIGTFVACTTSVCFEVSSRFYSDNHEQAKI
ncbi:hypothetical protein PMAYCL1PPCAC_03175 [Pristionchus mayeri]|uniref:Uncharacterized protein n=1 Tax=Pristionchus mayeri TaxID=1317129 RepID=A0AAN4Z870_9BILA|nr:hypothetical protein PMAYCL1PPCAC_03175 [Pristionchus mayeri]